MSHDQQPRTAKTEGVPQEDMSPEELAFRHAAPSHERPNNNRRNVLIGGGAVAGLAGLIAAGVFTLGGGDKKPAERSDVQEPGTSQSSAPNPNAEPTADPTQTPEVQLTPDLAPPAPVSVEDYADPADAIKALHDQLEEYVNSGGTYDRTTDTYEPGNEEYVTAIFGEEPRSERIQRFIDETYSQYADYAGACRDSLDPLYVAPGDYRLSLNNKNVHVASQDAKGAIVTMDVSASDNQIALEKEEYTKLNEGYSDAPEFDPSAFKMPDTMANWVNAQYDLTVVDGNWVITNIS